MTPKLEGANNSGASGGVGWIATGQQKSSSTVLGGGHAIGPMEDSQICGERYIWAWMFKTGFASMRVQMIS